MDFNFPRVDKSLELTPFLGSISEKDTLIVTKSLKFYTHPKIPVYSLRSGKNKGVLFFVNIINFLSPWKRRIGAEGDRDLIWVFRQLGFVVFYYEDVTWEALEKLLDSLVASEFLNKTDCFVLCISCHGNIDEGVEVVQFSDETIVDIEVILSKFYNDNCPALWNKPKVFILPYCRGENRDYGVRMAIPERPQTDAIAVKSVELPTKSDILICHGTVKGYAAYRHHRDGSWFIQALCRVFAEHAHDTDVETLLKIVNQEMCTGSREYFQTISVESWGFRMLFLTPGWQEEEKNEEII